MKSTILGLALLSLAGCAGVGDARPGDARADAAQPLAAWVAAYNTRDPAQIVAQYDADALLWGTVSPTLRKGSAAVADYFKDAAKRPQARVAVVAQESVARGDILVSAGSYTFTDVRDGKDVTNPSRFSFVFERRGGRWLIVHHHSSRMPAP